MSVQFQWDDPNRVLAELMKLLGDKGRAIARVPEAAVRRGTFELLALIQKYAPKKTSTLVRSISAVVTRLSDGEVEGRVGTWLKYAPYVERGTGIYGPSHKPIVIMAKAGHGLFWGAYDEGGKPIVRRRVTILGMKPRAPFGTAVQEFLPRYAEIVEQEVAKVS